MNNTLLKRVLVALLSVAMVVAYFPLFGNADAYAQSKGSDSESYYALPGEGEGGFVSADDALTKDALSVELNGQKNANAPKAKTNDVIEFGEEGLSAKGMIEEMVSVAEEEEPQSECGLAYVDPAIEEEPVDDGDDAEISAMGLAESGSTDDQEINAMGDTDVDADVDATDDADANAAGDVAEEEESLQMKGDGKYWISISNDATGIRTVSAHMGIDGVTFTQLRVDGVLIDTIDIEGKTDFSGETLNLRSFPVGYHTVEVYLQGKDSQGQSYDNIYMYFDHVARGIYAKPAVKLSDISTGYYYFDYYNSSYSSSFDGVLLDYKKAGRGWSTGYGPVGFFYSKRKAGLAAASVYSIRTYYIKNTRYTPPNGAAEAHQFRGPVSGVVSFKTGYKYTPVKSIKAKKLKQYCKKVKVKKLSKKIYWRNGYAGYGPYRKVLGTKTYKYWYTKVKVTVKMSKTPGVAGIYIGSKHVAGNKKTYTAKFTLSGKKKGKKIKVSVYSYMNRTYGGWSARTLKKVKVK